MNSVFSKTKRIISLILVVLTVMAFVPLTVSAQREQDMVLLSVHSSSINPEMGETITVTVKIDNYVSMRYWINSMHVGVYFDTSSFEFVSGSEKSELDVYSGDAVSVVYNNNDTVELFYTYANPAGEPLKRNEDMKLFSFQLRVKTDITSDRSTTFGITDDVFYTEDKEKHFKVEVREPIIDVINVWTKRPALLLNNKAENENKYSGFVVLQFPSTAEIVFDNREPITVTSPYTCSLNGVYTVTVKYGDATYSETFTIEKEIRSIGVKIGTLGTEFAIGVNPDYSFGRLLITYTDNTTAEIPMNDPAVTITGYDKNKAGQQTLNIQYMGITTSYAVTVSNKRVKEAVLHSEIAKKDYLVGDAIDTSGGFLFVLYDDKSTQTVQIGIDMLYGYNNSVPGEQSITIMYGGVTLPDAFKVTYHLRNNVDAVIAEIDSLVIAQLTSEDYDRIIAIKNNYEALQDYEKSAVTNVSKLNDAIAFINSIPHGSGDEETSPVTTDPNLTQKSGFSFKWIIYIIAAIVAISVIAGGVYFLVLYFKRKHDDKTEFYYSDEDDYDPYGETKLGKEFDDSDDLDDSEGDDDSEDEEEIEDDETDDDEEDEEDDEDYE